MSAWPERRRTGPLPSLLARATAWLVEPPVAAARRPAAIGSPSDASASEPPGRSRPALARASEPPPPVVAVLGLAPRAGASTVARALAGRLAGADPCGAAVLFTAAAPRAPIATPAASRLARLLTDLDACVSRPLGRLCLVGASEPLSPVVARRPAPVVADPGHGASAESAVALSDHVVLVCPPDIEPALAAAVEVSLREAGHAVSLVVNRALGGLPDGLEHALAIPDSRLAAQLTLTCREPRGALARAAAELAARSLAEARR